MAKSYSASLVDIPRITDPRGNLSFIQYPSVVPFSMKRVYWIYDIPTDSERSGRALFETDEFIVALSGSFDVVVERNYDDKTTFHLNCPYRGLYVPAGSWRVIRNFASNSVALVLASEIFHEEDYVRDYEQFKRFKAYPK